MEPNKSLLTTEEVAALARVKVTTVRRWLREGRLPGASLPGGAWRVRRGDLDRFLAPAQPRN